MNKKLILLFLALVLIALPLSVSCAKEEPAPAPVATTTTPSTTPSAPATPSPSTPASPSPATPEPEPETIKLKYSTPYFESMMYCCYHFMELVEENSEGRVVFECFPGGVLGTNNEHPDLLGQGMIDMANFSLKPIRDIVPLNNYNCWFLGGHEAALEYQMQLNWEIPETSAILNKEFEDLNIMQIRGFNSAGYNGIISREVFSSLADLKGKKLGTETAYPAMEELGIIPVEVSIMDMYESLSRGVVDAVTMALGPMVDLKWHEVTKCFMSNGQYVATHPVYMNIDSWNSLPPDIQEIFLEAALSTMEWSVEVDKETSANVLQIFRDTGLVEGTLPEDEIRNLYEIEYRLNLEEWLALCESKGKLAEAEVILEHWNQLTGIK